MRSWSLKRRDYVSKLLAIESRWPIFEFRFGKPINAIGKSGKCQTSRYTRRRSEGTRWRGKYVPLNLVYSHWANLGGYREIGDARPHNDVLDDRAWHHRIDHRRCCYPHVFAPEKRTISS